ncbi:AAA family ATPase [Paenactinomyces guangxiensis]|uniref:AAA family ATPase n=1 Tax=Paenactinomyces guangxiensis TaxID=1490290 RepID=A0A7W1WUY6_9BACL|nr:AAA family ATPase [Paenactinomyces guangxiensis]MBA4496422.1 AAA family ATPase [Paenactinomyces guangxiensis]MBH8593523.1 AAA family ATPase [Paenactinomyces guangxiensis]
MLLTRVTLRNYRNFIDAEFHLNKKSLIIGANDVGKTNILDAIRLLLDKGLSENDIEPKDEDFCALNNCSSFQIILHFVDIEEDCIHSKFEGYISDSNELYLAYFAYRESLGGVKKYELKAGPSEDELEDITSRFYLKVLNLKYVGASRQVDSFLRSQKNRLLERLKSNRTIEQIEYDAQQMKNVILLLANVQNELDKLSFIQDAKNLLNEELRKLAEHHVLQEVRLGVDIPKSNDLFRKVQLISYINEQAVQLGGGWT